MGEDGDGDETDITSMEADTDSSPGEPGNTASGGDRFVFSVRMDFDRVFWAMRDLCAWFGASVLIFLLITVAYNFWQFFACIGIVALVIWFIFEWDIKKW